MNQYEANERREYVRGLRQMADILESHPEQRLPMNEGFTFFTQHNGGDQTEQLAIFARTFPGKKDKRNWDHCGHNELWLVTHLGNLEVVCRSERSAVCTKRVVGTKKVVTEQLDPKWYATAPKITVEREEEIVEWDCPQLLASDPPPPSMLRDQLERSIELEEVAARR